MAATGTTSTEATARRNYPPAEELAVLAVLGVLEVLEVLEELAVSEELAASGGLGALAALEEREATGGSITRRIEAARLMVIATRRTALAGRLAETRWRIAKLRQGTRSDARAAICPAIAGAQAEPATAAGLVGVVGLVVQAELATAEVRG